MATITFTTRCTNETVSLPSEEAIERLFADADEWFAFQHRAPETAMELFFASTYDTEKTTINPYATEIEVNGVPMAISIKEEGGIPSARANGIPVHTRIGRRLTEPHCRPTSIAWHAAPWARLERPP